MTRTAQALELVGFALLIAVASWGLVLAIGGIALALIVPEALDVIVAEPWWAHALVLTLLVGGSTLMLLFVMAADVGESAEEKR